MSSRNRSVDWRNGLFFLVALLAWTSSVTTAQQSPGPPSQHPLAAESPMPADAHPSFEVATIKPSHPDDTKGGFQVGGHRLFIQNQTVNDLIGVAYAIHPKQIVDGPPWLETEHYDIVGQADVEGYPNLKQIQQMLQSLLETRFNLKFHREKRELSIYAITVAKAGPKLTKHTAPSNGLPTQSGSGTGDGRRFTNNSMSDFALGMQAFLDKPVVDQTGLEGRYDFVLRWSPDDASTDSPNPAPGIFTAVQEQLGLKLEPVKGPADVYVIDRVDKPSEN
ncbi:MAG: TIGR03435 family protein [Terracidiphilus sp.]